MSNTNAAVYMALGVAVPLRNVKYRQGTTLNTELASDGPTGPVVVDSVNNWYISVTSPTVASLNQTFRSTKDQVLIGPSTHPDNPGGREIVLVNSTTDASGRIYTITEPTYLYLAGDPVSGVGEKLAGSWDPSTTAFDDLIPLGITDTAYGEDAVIGGVYDSYRNYLVVEADTYLQQELATDALLSNTQYLFGCFYQMPIKDSSSPDYYVSIYDQSGLAASDRFLHQVLHRGSQGALSDWTMFTSETLPSTSIFARDGVNGVTGSAPSACVIRFPYGIGGGATLRSYCMSDMPFLCHAQRTTAYKDGIYNFDHFPVLNSSTWSWVDSIRQVRLANGELREFDTTGGGGRTRKHTFSCRFENTSSEFYDNINSLHKWQEEGNELVLLTGEQYYGKTLPPILVGKMATKRVDKGSWALGLRSFTFTFNET